MPRFTEGLSWTFTDVKEEGDSAAITAEITNRDLGALIAAFLQEAFSQMMSTIFLPEDQQPTEEEQTAAPAPEQAAQPEEPAAQESSAEADKTEEEPEEDKQPTTVFEPVQPDTDFTREFRFDLEDLKFGHNYQSGKQ